MSQTENKESLDNSPKFPPKRILVAVDGSKNSLRAATAAIDLAKSNHADELLVLNVIAIPVTMIVTPVGASSYPIVPPEMYSDIESQAHDVVENVSTLAKNAGLNVRTVVERPKSSVVECIVEKATAEKVDLIVIGTRGLGGFERLLLGSVSSGVVSHAHCNVLVVR
jgi:nucleotide-binding universal stress UspA family protein